MKAFQAHCAADVAHCYGCGALNTHGHRIKTHWVLRLAVPPGTTRLRA